MPKTTKRRPAPKTTANPRLEAKRAEKRELTKYLRECRAVTQLARKLKRAVQVVDDDLASLSIWLSVRHIVLEDSGARSDKLEPEPANI